MKHTAAPSRALQRTALIAWALLASFTLACTLSLACTLPAFADDADDAEETQHTWDGNVCTTCGELLETSLDGAEVTLSKTTYTYNGSSRTPIPTVTLNGTELAASSDYTVSYSDNTDAGTATATVTGTGSYSGSTSVQFTINRKSISGFTVKLSKTAYTYNGKAKKPKVAVTSGSATINSDHYSVSYASGRKKCGKYKVTVKGTGNYKGTVVRYFKIKPAKASAPTLSSTASKQIKVKLTKSAGGVSGYQVAYRVKGASTWKKTTTTSLTKKLKGLKAGKTYQVKVRAYKTIDSKKYYGAWSKVKKVKCKGDKVVYLTFDDGPSALMGDVLDVLDKYNVKATFFVTGNNASYRSMITRAYNEGHAIGLHSYTHNYSSIYKSKSAFFSDLKKISSLVEDLTGEKTYLLRFPGGSSNTVSRNYCSGIMTTLTAAVEAKGYTYFDWNVDSTDASGSNVSVSTIVANSTTTAYSKVNLLMHCTDSKGTTLKALPKIIKYYKAHGYVFEVLTTSSYEVHHGVNN